MKRYITAGILLVLLTGCAGYVTDQLYTTRARKEELVIFCCNDSYYSTDRRVFDSEGLLDMEDGAFAFITADVTYLNGGIAGYQNVPQIDKLRSFTPAGLDEVRERYDIPELTSHPQNVAWQLYQWHYEEEAYYFYFLNGNGYLYQDGERIGMYENLSQEADVTAFLAEQLTTMS